MSIQARDRKLDTWFKRIKDGEIKLPRFQRFEAWDKNRISSLLNTIIHDLPLGITLILEVDQEQFISRYLSTAEVKSSSPPRVIEHLLDGQQRLTAIWRALHNNYEWEKYFLYIRAFDTVWIKESPVESPDDDWAGEEAVICQGRWEGKKSKKLMPIWTDDPEECIKRGCIPFDLLSPEDNNEAITKWINAAIEYKRPKAGSPDFEKLFEQFSEERQKLVTLINKFKETVRHYNLPFLALPSDTPKQVALDVFINMNTNSKPLSQYDIIVAEIEGISDTSVHKLQKEMDATHPSIKRYSDLSYLILNTSALMQEKVPNQVGVWDMNKRKVVEDWPNMVKGLSRMASFLEAHKIYDEQRLPTNAVLAVIAALYTHIPETGDRAGQATVLLKKYMWSSFFTDRYENSAASRAYADYIALLGIILQRTKPNSDATYQENDVPVLNRNITPLSMEDQLLHVTWPKRVTIRGRGILAVANYFNAFDFADGAGISPTNVTRREYHHIFPDALLEEARGVYKELVSDIALNCALITNTTNRVIGRKDPLNYLKERYDWANEKIVEQRLNSHLIPVPELKAGTYENFEASVRAEKIKTDFNQFISQRAKLITKAVDRLVKGEEVTSIEIITNQ
jgi:hypothetical protein